MPSVFFRVSAFGLRISPAPLDLTKSTNAVAMQTSIMPPTSPRVAGAAARLGSLDAFRGLVILTMTFVNYLGHVQNIPAWARHVPQSQEGYTFVDVVFPGFLFIVGVAIPLALHKRMARGDSPLALLWRILVRSASLIFVGVIMVNTGYYNADAALLGKNLWFLLAMLSVVALWSTRPAEASKRRKRVHLAIRILAVPMLAALLFLFRGKDAAGHVVWLQHAWWGILGLIGWAYLTCCLAYLLFRGSSVALMGVLGFLIALYIGDRHGRWIGWAPSTTSSASAPSSAAPRPTSWSACWWATASSASPHR